MAIDTTAKRFSVLGMCDSIGAPLPFPNGAFSTGDLAQFLSLYRGFADEATVAAGDIASRTRFDPRLQVIVARRWRH